ncbi:UPF0392 protein F13G3.3 [Toxocara canis]|uniref:Glycosyltransferase family 92 protein n=1 Tax=Toxocara canis TaxID=6265 RepID=A0A0B2V621_TOXCA|nr:UPF0392 protein F13G3.3 [Toxocara canis]
MARHVQLNAGLWQRKRIECDLTCTKSIFWRRSKRDLEETCQSRIHSRESEALVGYVAITMITRFAQAFQIPYSPAIRKPEKLIFCSHSTYLFDKWQVMLIVLELNKYYGVTLTIVYIESIISEMFDILQGYERDGSVLIKHGHQSPQVDLALNMDNEYRNQMVVINDCLYQFKDAAEFAIISDWDEVILLGDLFGRPLPSEIGSVFELGPTSFYDFLKTIMDNDEKIGSFVFDRLHTNIISRNRFNLLNSYIAVA